MKCSTDCPMEALRKMGKTCQFKDMKKDVSCRFLDTFAFVKEQNEEELKEQAKKVAAMKEEPKKPYYDESQVGDEAIVDEKTSA